MFASGQDFAGAGSTLNLPTPLPFTLPLTLPLTLTSTLALTLTRRGQHERP